MTRSRPPLSTAPAAGLLLLLLAACGGSDAAVQTSRHALVQGDFERAVAALADASGPAVEAQRRAIAERRAQLEAFDAELARLAELDPPAEASGLEALAFSTDDRLLLERYELAVSDAADRAAEWNSSSSTRRRDAERDLRQREARRAREEREREQAAARLAGSDSTPTASTSEVPATSTPDPSGGLSGEAPTPAVAAASTPEDDETSDAEEPAAPVVEDEPIVTALDLLRPELEREERDLTRAKTERRDADAQALLERGLVAEPFLARAIEARWAAAMKDALKSPSLKSLEKLSQDRVELDYRREQALELIFDTDEYFYPYRPPECPPEKARLYWPVQQRVDELVADLREVWDSPRSAKLASGFREALEELVWCQAQQPALTVALKLDVPEELPSWVFHLPLGEKSIDLRSFAWTAEEAQELRYDGAVLAFNARQWEAAQQKELDEERRAASEEQLQVEITNAYRQMFGRRRLAWNALLQESSGGHSDYMAKTGNFGHYEEEHPDRRTPFDRMALVGYHRGVSENCHMGGGSAQGAHEGWTHSSGHHRNLLMSGHKEMGSASNGAYWTQNFGTDTSFQSELDSWLD